MNYAEIRCPLNYDIEGRVAILNERKCVVFPGTERIIVPRDINDPREISFTSQAKIETSGKYTSAKRTDFTKLDIGTPHTIIISAQMLLLQDEIVRQNLPRFETFENNPRLQFKKKELRQLLVPAEAKIERYLRENGVSFDSEKAYLDFYIFNENHRGD